MSRYRLRSGQRASQRLRMIATAVAAVSAVLFLLLIVFFNLSDKEEGYASGSMAFRQVTVSQDTTPVLRGSIHQKVLGVTIETFGKGAPIKVQRLVFQALGLSTVNRKNMENARVWYTGNDPEFSPQELIGSTVMSMSDEPLVIRASQELMQGKNHFWLTFDLKSDALTPNSWMDAACMEVVVGGISHVPSVPSPEGRRWIQNNVPYYSMGNLSLNKVASWNSRRDGSGVHPRKMNETRNSYFIQSGHRMISSTGGNLQTLVVERGGELKITSPLRLNTMQVVFGGNVHLESEDDGTILFNDFVMEKGASYFHGSSGKIPAFYCDFAPGSYQIFYNYSESTFSRPLEFGSVIFDAGSAPEITIRPENLLVKGDLELRNTGFHAVTLSEGQALIEGDLVISGGILRYGVEGGVNIKVGRALKLFAGKISDTPGFSSAASSSLNVNGDVLLLGGKIDLSQSGRSELNLFGPGLTRWVQRDSCKVMLGNVRVQTRHALVWKGTRVGPLSDNAYWRVETGAELHCGTSVLEGKGGFILEDMASLSIGHPDGIYSTGKKGNVQTSVRQYHSGAIYRYDGAAHPQLTGEFKTTPSPQTVRRLIVDKPSTASVLHLSQDLVVKEHCRVQNGDLRQNGYSLTLPDNRMTGFK